MTAKDAYLWDFDKPITDTSVIVCPDCKEPTPLADWTETEVLCETCGGHAAMKCSRCGNVFDHVRGPTFEVRD